MMILNNIRNGSNLDSLVSQLNSPQQIAEWDTPWIGYPLYFRVAVLLYIYWWLGTRDCILVFVIRLQHMIHGVIVLELLRDNGDYSTRDFNSGHNVTVYYGNDNLRHEKYDWGHSEDFWLCLTIFDNKSVDDSKRVEGITMVRNCTDMDAIHNIIFIDALCWYHKWTEVKSYTVTCQDGQERWGHIISLIDVSIWKLLMHNR